MHLLHPQRIPPTILKGNHDTYTVRKTKTKKINNNNKKQYTQSFSLVPIATAKKSKAMFCHCRLSLFNFFH